MLNEEVLVLNQNYEPLTFCRARRALVLLYLGKAELVESYNGKIVRSVKNWLPLPSVLRLNRFIKVTRREIPLTKRNILRRDNHQCQYCGKKTGPMTTDHVIPKGKGGTDSWENLVCACVECNTKKGNKPYMSVGLKLLRKPKKPTYLQFILSSRDKIPEEWRPYLFVDSQ
ncbi:MAG: HNH endonuclease [candidate division WOR-3 bacterium]